MPVDYDNQICACGKEYSNDGQFNRHLKTCKKVQAIESKAHKQGSRIWAREEKEGQLKTWKDPFSKRAKLTHDYGEGSSMTRQEEGHRSMGPVTAGGSKDAYRLDDRSSSPRLSQSDRDWDSSEAGMYPDFSEDVDIPPTSDNTLPMIPELEELDPLPEKRTRRPTAKIIAALEDTLPPPRPRAIHESPYMFMNGFAL
ncbi:hypothetical protein ARMGADRAFT_1080003 [Armillaria gallica]|uniref:Uncharacterized protein n=1 Tax=Armillaria gallica TaxID=47427 RepID=A0A2H3DER8_ARMGA|nr:hypothetical protein ARMGADRAFT_1080003 [Armillaria gallica]